MTLKPYSNQDDASFLEREDEAAAFLHRLGLGLGLAVRVRVRVRIRVRVLYYLKEYTFFSWERSTTTSRTRPAHGLCTMRYVASQSGQTAIEAPSTYTVL